MGRRRGFTLVEILVALALMLIVTGAVYRLLLTTQRLSRLQAAQVNLQATVRTGSLVVANELRELSTVAMGTAEQNDVLSISSSDVVYRASRGIGFVCQPPALGQLRIARSGFSAPRDPQPGRDIAYVFVEGAPDTGSDDSWLPLAITGLSTASLCPGASGPAISLSTSAIPPAVEVPVGTPVRIYEIMQLKLYQSDGQWWLGARSVSAGEAIQPLAGPLAGPSGLHLEYLGREGAATSDPTAVKSIRVTLRGRGEDAVSSPNNEPLAEELDAQVTLRNALLP